MIKIRKSKDRGSAELGWLKSKHTFSFSDYHDPEHMGFSSLRVINEDWVSESKGFGMHPHKDMEIITYVVEGQLQHKDSMGNTAVILPGDVQKMSAGKGVLHSEFNPSDLESTHLLQIWIVPNQKGVDPAYFQKSFQTDIASKKLVLVVSPDGKEGSLPIFQDAYLYVSRLKNSDSLTFNTQRKRSHWVQVVKGDLQVNGVSATAGDGLAITEEEKLEISSISSTEFLLFDLANS